MRATASIAVISLALGSCNRLAGPAATANWPMQAPAAWQAAAEGPHGRIATGWLKELREPRLEALVHQAIDGNHTLAIAASRMAQAREGALIARARLLPSADAIGSTTVTESLNTSVDQDYRLRLGVSWEVDLWGRLRDLKSAAAQDARAATEDYRSARLSLAAATAKAWCHLVSANQQMDLARTTLDSYEKNLRIIERLYKGTGEGVLDIQFSRTNVAAAQRALESRRLERDEAARSIEMLLGAYPTGSLSAGDRLPVLKAGVPAGLPAELLERRPDIRAAAARLAASAGEASAARKALLPDLAITGSSANTTGSFSRLLDLNELVHTLTGVVGQNLFSGGSLSATSRQAAERNREEIHRYARTVLEAWREVESALAAERSLARQEGFLADEVTQAELAERVAERDYTEGINPNILSVLEAQRRANNARSGMIRLRNDRLQNRIDLHLALGGDFATPNP